MEGGVASVSLCSPASLAKELFTYEGSGTFFTLTDYCQAERLALDDFPEAERLIQRGEQEGALKKRTPSEISQLLLHGYGARLGTERDLVGLCALLPYIADNAGEIAGLYTLRRFHGEGIGSRLVGKAITEGQARGLAYLFACTNQEGARRLFERFDFHQVKPDAVPATKWHAYAPERKRAISVYKRDYRKTTGAQHAWIAQSRNLFSRTARPAIVTPAFITKTLISAPPDFSEGPSWSPWHRNDLGRSPGLGLRTARTLRLPESHLRAPNPCRPLWFQP